MKSLVLAFAWTCLLTGQVAADSSGIHFYPKTKDRVTSQDGAGLSSIALRYLND